MNIPSAKDIDYTSVDEICGYQMLLCKLFEKAGGFGIGFASSKEIAMVRREGMTWLQNVEEAIKRILYSPGTNDKVVKRLTLGAIPRILTSYDFFYRVCHSGPCFTFVRDTALKVADNWVHGDKSISTACVTLLLLKEIERDILAIPQRYIDFSMRVLDSWIKELRSFGRLQNLSSADSYSVMSFLLLCDLFAFGVSRAERIQWIETYTLSVGEIDKLDAMTLWAYMDYDQKSSIFSGESITIQDERYVRLISKIAAHPESNRFSREAIELHLAKRQVA